MNCDLCRQSPATLFLRVGIRNGYALPRYHKARSCKECADILTIVCYDESNLNQSACLDVISQQDFNALMDPMYEPG